MEDSKNVFTVKRNKEKQIPLHGGAIGEFYKVIQASQNLFLHLSFNNLDTFSP